jgi:uncharacterized protein with von Willebrand factor type A (vWA) domain
MLINFFYQLRTLKIPVSILEFLTLLEALKHDVIPPSMQEFYFLARMILVKDEKYYDRFDQAFNQYFSGIDNVMQIAGEITEDWLVKKLMRELSAEDKAKIQKLGSLEDLFKRLNELIQEQKGRHEGGNK